MLQAMLYVKAVCFDQDMNLHILCLLSKKQSCAGYDQQRLSLIFSTGAATTVLTQLVLFPALVAAPGVCTYDKQE